MSEFSPLPFGIAILRLSLSGAWGALSEVHAVGEDAHSALDEWATKSSGTLRT